MNAWTHSASYQQVRLLVLVGDILLALLVPMKHGLNAAGYPSTAADLSIPL